MKRWKKFLSVALACALLTTVVPLRFTASATSFEGNTELSKQVAEEGMVLLENPGKVLPLPAGESVALFGSGQIDFVKGGGGSGNVNTAYVINLLQGMQNQQSGGKITLYQPLIDAYTEYLKTHDGEMPLTDAQVEDAAEAADTAVVTISRYSGEGSDRSSGKGDYLLSDAEVAMLNKVTQNFSKVAVVLNIGGVIDTSWIKNYPGISVLVAWQPGMEGGNAAAEVLCGAANPSGKLVDTFAKDYNDYPTSASFKENANYVNYEEDVFVGYRWFETFDPTYQKVNYPFGYGLSYTTFDISDVAVTHDEENIHISAKVTNTGAAAGKEVVQAYFSAPQMGTGSAKLGKPAKELAAFAKTGLLAPGSSQTVNLSFPISDMSSYDDTGVTGKKSAYVLEAGDYDIYVGNSVRDAGEKGVRGTYTVDTLTVTQQLTEQMAPAQLKRRLLADGTYQNLAYRNAVSASGSTRIEAENFSDATKGENAVRTEKFSTEARTGTCIAYMNFAGNYVSYDFDVEEAGTYSLSFSASNGYPAMTDIMKIYVNDTLQPNVKVDLPRTGDGSGKGEWYNFIDTAPVLLTLPKGQCTFKIVSNGKFGNLDYLTLHRVFGIKAAGQTKIESEAYADATSTGNYVRVESFNTSSGSGKCVAYMNYANNYISYDLDVEEAGSYRLVFRASNGRPAMTDIMKIYVNGTLQPGVRVDLPQTGVGDGGGEWYNFIDTAPVLVTLPQGQCTLKIVCNADNKFGNLDYMVFEKAEQAQTAPAPADTTAAAKVSASPQAQEAAAPSVIQLADVYRNPELMDQFIAQLSDQQLADLSGGHGSTIGGTGGIGGLSEYGIPKAQTSDGPAGLRLPTKCTAWPCATLVACTWDVNLIQQMGVAVGKEAKLNGVDIWLAPGMNIHRNPLCGRNFEYYSEDPLIAGDTAAALTLGVQSQHVGVTLKHFAGNNKEGNRSNSDSRVSERALREIYLKGFEIAVEKADPWFIMSSYNLINGTETAERYDLLTEVLRNEWGFQGMVMTDWGNNSTQWKEAKAGNDVKMSSGNAASLISAISSGNLTRAELERNIKHVLTSIMKTNAFLDRIVGAEPTEISSTAPTRIKAVNYLWASDAISSETCEDTDGGLNPTHTDAGQWLSYSINVPHGGVYSFTPRIAVSSKTNTSFDIVLDDEKVGTFTQAAPTGGWQVWTTGAPVQIRLPKGEHTLKLAFTVSGMNINWFEFNPVALSADVAEVTDPQPVSVPYGTELEAGRLPEKVEVTLSDESKTELPVVWSPEGYHADVPGTYTLTGTLTLPQDGSITNEGNLTASIEVTVLPKNLDHLNDLIAACEKLDENKFEVQSWANLQAKLAAAKEVAENPGAAPEAISAAFDQLSQARNDLVYSVDKDILRLSIEIAQNTDTTGCTSGSIAALNEALEAAQTVLKQTDATQEEVNDAAKALLNAVINLKDIMADKAELQKLADLAAGLTEAKYTPASWSTVKGALEAVQALLPDDDATQEAVDGAYGTLAQAIAHLTLRAQTNSLEVAITLAQTIVSELDRYAPATVEGLQEKLDAAKAVQGNLNATQEEVDAAAKALAEAAAKARLKANKKDLQQAYAQAQKLDDGKYTEGSVKRLSAALTTTAAVLKNENATQQEVDKAKDVLSDAVQTLEVKSTGGTENSSSENENSSSPNGNSSSNNSSSGNGSSSSLNSSSSEHDGGTVSTVPTGTSTEDGTESPQTGEPFPTAVPVLSMAALAGITLVLFFRKKIIRQK